MPCYQSESGFIIIPAHPGESLSERLPNLDPQQPASSQAQPSPREAEKPLRRCASYPSAGNRRACGHDERRRRLRIPPLFGAVEKVRPRSVDFSLIGRNRSPPSFRCRSQPMREGSTESIFTPIAFRQGSRASAGNEMPPFIHPHPQMDSGFRRNDEQRRIHT